MPPEVCCAAADEEGLRDRAGCAAMAHAKSATIASPLVPSPAPHHTRFERDTTPDASVPSGIDQRGGASWKADGDRACGSVGAKAGADGTSDATERTTAPNAEGDVRAP